MKSGAHCYGGPEGSLPIAFLFKRFLCLSDLFQQFVSAILFRRFVSSICFSDFVSSICFFDLFQRFRFVDLFLRFVSAILFRRLVFLFSAIITSHLRNRPMFYLLCIYLLSLVSGFTLYTIIYISMCIPVPTIYIGVE